MGNMNLLGVVAFVTALGCGLIAGTFFAFSAAVMKSLAKLPPAHGIAAMQSINITIINPWFLGPFLGTAVLSAVMMSAAALQRQHPDAPYWLIGGALYFAGTFLVTMMINVPLNNVLAAVAPASPEGARVWATYLATWTYWNHVRGAAALAAAALFILAVA